MRLVDHPHLLDRLAAAYALGTLRGGARRRFEAMARVQAPVRAAALVWQARIAGLLEVQADVQPPAAVWQRIDNLVQAELQQSRQRALLQAGQDEPGPRSNWLQALWPWRLASAGSLALAVIAAVVGWQGITERDTQLAIVSTERDTARSAATTASQQVATLQAQAASAPRIEYVAVLADDRAAAHVLVTFDPAARRLTLQRVGGYSEGSDKSLQLWAVTPGSTPRSLGVLGESGPMRIAAEAPAVTSAPVLAISLEPKGGVSGEKGPTGPVLFTGRLLKTEL